VRYYNITISPPASAQGQGTFVPFSFSSQTNGKDNYSALQLDLDIYQTSFSSYSSNGYLRLMGVDLKALQQKANINPEIASDGSRINLPQITVEVGMSKGLPYANQNQKGVILNGGIIQAFSNWQGNQVSLDMVLAPVGVDQNATNNITFNCNKGQDLTSATITALQNAYPNAKITGSFSSKLIYTENAPAQHYNLFSFSQVLNSISKQIISSPTYTGALIVSTNSGFVLTDSTITPSITKKIAFTDVIGNLTWLGINTISAKVVMRGDLNVADYISFESGIPVSNIVNNQSQYRNKISFNGVFYITKLHHVGNSRNGDGNSWVTIIEAIIPNTPIHQTL